MDLMHWKHPLLPLPLLLVSLRIGETSGDLPMLQGGGFAAGGTRFAPFEHQFSF